MSPISSFLSATSKQDVPDPRTSQVVSVNENLTTVRAKATASIQDSRHGPTRTAIFSLTFQAQVGSESPEPTGVKKGKQESRPR